jgi:protease-4
MSQQLPPGHGPVDPAAAFTPPGTGPVFNGAPGRGPTPGNPAGNGPAGANPSGVIPGSVHSQMPGGPIPGPMPGGPMPGPMYGGPMMPGPMMPGPMMPGPMFYPPMPPGFQPPPPRRGWGKLIIILLLLFALGTSVLVNFAQLSTSMTSTSNSKQTTLVAGDESTKIAVVPIDGLIDDAQAKQFSQLLDDVERQTDVKALVVEIDTPGGSATASDEMYHRLSVFKTNETAGSKNFPIVIAMRGMATSGGYYVACAGDYLIAEPGTMTGNIGVLFPRFNISGLMDKYGLQETTITATTTGHSFKNAGSMFKPEVPEDEAYLQGLVDATFAQFKGVVQTGRGTKLKDPGDIFSGKAFMAADALTRGLIDQIDYPEAAYDKAAKDAGVSNKTVVRFTRPDNIFADLLGSQSKMNPAGGFGTSGNTSAGGATINGVNIDGSALRDLVSSRPMLLWRGN